MTRSICIKLISRGFLRSATAGGGRGGASNPILGVRLHVGTILRLWDGAATARGHTIGCLGVSHQIARKNLGQPVRILEFESGAYWAERDPPRNLYGRKPSLASSIPLRSAGKPALRLDQARTRHGFIVASNRDVDPTLMPPCRVVRVEVDAVAMGRRPAFSLAAAAPDDAKCSLISAASISFASFRKGRNVYAQVSGASAAGTLASTVAGNPNDTDR